MGLRRKRGQHKAPNKVCLNLFFDGSNVSIPKIKRNLYTAHEVLQMKPLFSKRGTYERFLEENEWVYELFPNVKSLDERFPALVGSLPSLDLRSGRASQVAIKRSFSLLTHLGYLVENVLKNFQLLLINRHKTSEIVTNTQLWFFPNDFEKKLREKGIV